VSASAHAERIDLHPPAASAAGALAAESHDPRPIHAPALGAQDGDHAAVAGAPAVEADHAAAAVEQHDRLAPAAAHAPDDEQPVSAEAKRDLGAAAGRAREAFTSLASSASAAQQPVDLGTADTFAALAGTTVTNAGFSTLNGDLGVSPGSALTGFPPGVVNGTTHAADPVAAQAQADLTTAYNGLSILIAMVAPFRSVGFMSSE